MAPAMPLVGNVCRQVGGNVVDDPAGRIDTAGKSAVVAVTALEIRAGVELRILGMDLNYAAGRVAAEQSTLRAFENIDAGYGVELKNRRIAVRDINVIEINGDRAFLAGTVRVGSDPANERGGRVDFVRSVLMAPAFMTASGVIGTTEIGTFWAFSTWRCAVTVISTSWSVAALSAGSE